LTSRAARAATIGKIKKGRGGSEEERLGGIEEFITLKEGGKKGREGGEGYVKKIKSSKYLWPAGLYVPGLHAFAQHVEAPQLGM